MPNIKSAIKRVKTSEKKNKINVAHKSALKTSLKKFNEALGDEDINITGIHSKVVQDIDKAVSKGVLHKNAAARRKSIIAKKINNLANSKNASEPVKTQKKVARSDSSILKTDTKKEKANVRDEVKETTTEE